VATFDGTPLTPGEKYADAPFAAGLLEGYLTMDSIASLAFGIIVISALKNSALPAGKPLVRSTILAGLGAGLMLGVVYVALGFIGQIIPDPGQYDNGAGLLADAANLAMGYPGQIIFGLIVLLACLTTAVGLIAATSEFFHLLVPAISYKAWAIGFSLLSFALATQGLSTVLAVAAPVIGFISPPAIALIFVTLIQPLLYRRVNLFWTFRLSIWVAVLWSALVTLNDLGWGSSVIEPLISWSPMHDLSLGWVLPTVVGFIVGLLIDVAKPTDPALSRGQRVAVSA